MPSRFDLNSPAVRRRYAHVFKRENPSSDPDGIAGCHPPSGLNAASMRATAGVGAAGRSSGVGVGASRSRGNKSVMGCRRALFGVDPKHASRRLFLVLQLSKVLQGEPEKVCLSRGHSSLL